MSQITFNSTLVQHIVQHVNSELLALRERNSPVIPYNRPVTRKELPCHDVIMPNENGKD